jgi:hypothetical protein
MNLNLILFLIILVVVIILFIIAWKKKWIGSPAGGIFTSQVIMHDWMTKDKQRAIEYIIEKQEDAEKRKGDSGEGPEGGAYLDE